MATSDFLVWAPSGGNVMTQSAYASNTFLANGVVTGLADNTLYNKSIRQSSIMSAALAGIINSQTGQNAVDDGTTATIQANLLKALLLSQYGGASSANNPNTSCNVSFTANCNGVLLVVGVAGQNTGNFATCQFSGTGVTNIAQTGNTSFGATSNLAVSAAIFSVSAGASVSVTFAMTGSGAYVPATNISFVYLLLPHS